MYYHHNRLFPTILPIVTNTKGERDYLLGYLIVFQSNSCWSLLSWVPIEKRRIVGGEVFYSAVSYIHSICDSAHLCPSSAFRSTSFHPSPSSLYIGRGALLLNGSGEVEEAIMRYEMVDLPWLLLQRVSLPWTGWYGIKCHQRSLQH